MSMPTRCRGYPAAMACIGARLFLVGSFLLAHCAHVTTHPGTVESAPDSCQRPALTQVTCVPTVVH
ncbi:hypothetical protein T05_1681 [Trichinella murrelli]|uniref:Uncharacterized protein n=1 Tax=Trichinella murrelli TaxID=144512 RepID=A0A0V0RV91_9BILA|nr:hypothetical protein T05_1681 [Trichinella murrelli]